MSSEDFSTEPVVYDKKEFCRIHRMSIPTFDRMIKEGFGPRIIKFKGKKAKVLVTREAAAEWRRKMESKE